MRSDPRRPRGFALRQERALRRSQSHRRAEYGSRPTCPVRWAQRLLSWRYQQGIAFQVRPRLYRDELFAVREIDIPIAVFQGHCIHGMSPPR